MKKVLSFLSVIMLTVMVSVFFVACGDKYKNMYLEVQYLELTTDGEGVKHGEWKTIDVNPSSENYGLSFVLNDNYKSKTGNYYELTMRVLVKGTKKSVDQIYVSCPEGELSNNTVTDGSQFVIRFSTTESPYLFVTPSIKSDTASVGFPIVFYSELESIAINSNYYPAIAKGSTLDLNTLEDLIVYTGAGGIDTNQLGVVYSIDDVEPENGVYTIYDNEGDTFVLDITNNINQIRVGTHFNDTDGAISIRATSVYYDYINVEDGVNKDELLSKLISVKVVDNVSNDKICLNYKKDCIDEDGNLKGTDENNSKEIETVMLYQDSKDYSDTDLVLSGVVGVNSVYKFIDNESSDVGYKVDILIYDNDKNAHVNIADYNNMHKGVQVIENLNTGANVYKEYNIGLYEYSGLTENLIRFVIGFDNLKFTGKDYSLSGKAFIYDLKIVRADLPNALYINGESYRDGQQLDGIIYDQYIADPENPDVQKGYELNINAVREYQESTKINLTVGYEGDGEGPNDYHRLQAYLYNGQLVDLSLPLTNLTNKIFLKFKEEVGKIFPDYVNIEFDALSSPEQFEGEVVTKEEYIKVTLRLRVSGVLGNISSTGEDKQNNNLFGTSQVKYVVANTDYLTYINLVPSGGVEVSGETVRISSENNSILLSSDGKNWVNSIKHGELSNSLLHVKGTVGIQDKLIVTADNGGKFVSTTIKFVETTGNHATGLSFDSTYIYNAYNKTIDNAAKFENNYYTKDSKTYSGYYLAMQLGQNTDFTVSYNNGKTAAVFDVYATNLSILDVVGMGKTIHAYAVNSVKPTNFSNGYSFNLSANNANLTTVIKVDYSYYFGYKDSVNIGYNTIYIEVAVYVPVNDLVLEATNNEIYYVNKLVTDKAATSIVATVNSSATKNIYFSNGEINDKINASDKNFTGYMYNVLISHEDFAAKGYGIQEQGKIPSYQYLDLTKNLYTLTLTKNCLSEDEKEIDIKIDFIVQELAYERVFTKVIKITRHTESKGIQVSGTYDDNMYLSLLSDEDKQASFSAKISNIDATYPNLQYELYEFNEFAEHFRGERVFYDDKLKVNIDNSSNKVTLEAGNQGGKYVLRLIAPDSFDDINGDYKHDYDVIVTISDGTAASPYHLRTIEDVKKIKGAYDKYFVLASNINLSTLDGQIAEVFSGNLSGAINIFNANTTTSVYSQYKFTDIRITNKYIPSVVSSAEFNCGLFGKVTGTISNLVLDRVTFDNITVEDGASNYTINIGALAGANEGNIINSSITMLSSTINVEDNEYSSVNIGGLVGENRSIINYFDKANIVNKKYASTIQAAIYYNKLKVNVNRIVSSTTLNIGGLIGNNSDTSIFTANYFDYNNNLFKEYLTADVDIDVNISSSIDVGKYTANIGGIVGNNTGVISQVSVTGVVEASGNNIAVGGIVGFNEYTLKDSASYTTEVLGLPYYETHTEVKNQYVGGIVGELTGTGSIENVDLIFVDLRNLGFDSSINASISGVCVVGGLVGKSNGSIKNGNVQSFFIDKPVIKADFRNNTNVLGSKLLGGLVGLDVGCYIESSFVSANIETYCPVSVNTLTSGSNINNAAYYVGEIEIYDNEGALQTLDGIILNINSSSDVYSLVIGYQYVNPTSNHVYTFGKLTYDSGIKGYYYPNGNCWIANSADIVFADDVFNDESEKVCAPVLTGLNSVYWNNDSIYTKQNFDLNVIKYGENVTIIALPDELKADVLDKEFGGNGKVTEPVVYKNDNGIFISNVEYNTAIVFKTDKTYNLVELNGENGLIKKEVLPSVASGQYYVRVISGSNVCTLTGNIIKFINLGRIELEFVSLFNSNAKDRVVIFVENPINNFRILNGGKILTSLNVQTNINKLIEFNALFNGENSNINNQNLFFYFDFEEDDVPINLNCLGNVKYKDDVNLDLIYYTFADLQLQIGNIEEKEKSFTLNTYLYLDLAKYIYSYETLEGGGVLQKTLQDRFGIDTVLLAQQELIVNVYQSASELKVDTAEQNIPSSKDTSIEFDVITSFIDKDVVGANDVEFIAPVGNDLYGKSEYETFKCIISSEHEKDWVKRYGINSLWDLFTYSASYTLKDDLSGYHFTFYFELKEEYKAITRNEEFEFKFVAITNDSAKDITTVTYTPQVVNNLRIENFKSGVVSVRGDGKVEYISDETHSSIIVPGKNGLIKIYVEPFYASVDMVEISSSQIDVNGSIYTVRFQQMLYDSRLEHYVSYPGYTTENNTLKLQKNSYINMDGKLVYSGVIYVRTILESMIGVSETFEIKVNSYTYLRDENGEYDKYNPVINESRTKTTSKYLLTDYAPGVSLRVSNLLTSTVGDDRVYLIEKSSVNAVVTANIFGYHINQQPIITLTWLDGSSVELNKYINYSIGDIIKQSNGSYNVSINLSTKNLDKPFKMCMDLSLISEGAPTTAQSETLIFYPVDYIPSDVYLKNSGNDYLNVSVNSSVYFDFVWLSVGQDLNSNAINTLLFEQDINNNSDNLDFLYTESYSTSGILQANYMTPGRFATYEITADNNAKRYSITALGEDILTITFYVKYSYIYDDTTGKFNIEFYPTKGSNDGDYAIRYTFTLRFNISTTEETADPIWTAEQFRDSMTAGGNYTLMEDITLTDWVPMEANFASLDGNGKVIKIESFAVNTAESINAGLFATVSQNTILKNLVVDISACQSTIMLADENNVTGETNFGFISGVNNGIIYNTEVINTKTETFGKEEKEITIETSSTKSNIGLFVGKNVGIITNSRVGTPYFEKIVVKELGSTESTKIDTSVFTVKADGIVAGFVAENNGIISSSYFNNANIINTNKVGVDDTNMTAGFVAINSNNGTISGSYAKGQGITTKNVRGSDTGVFNTGAGSAAGFVFKNLGLIENCYSNLRVESSSFGVAGFVYNNTASGTIKQSYSASKVISSSTNVSLAVELPFVGVDILNNLQSYGALENCYYLELSEDTYDTNYLFTTDMDMPTGLNQVNFAVSDNLLNFAFVNGNYEQSVQGVWTYYATLDKHDEKTYSLGKTSLPELTSANYIARSIRYIVETENEKGQLEHNLTYANGYSRGTTNNPYVIRDYNEYNDVFDFNKEDVSFNSFTGNIRFINDVDFTLENDDTATINTTLGFALGDKNNQTLTIVDGNGMTIRGVNTKNNEALEQNSLGLFNTINYSIVKNLNIEYADMKYTSTRAMYSGGLAGKIDDSHIIGIDLVGANTTISAFNFAGGLAGVITGDSGVYNVTSNLSIKVGRENLIRHYQYISEDKFSSVYAGLGYNFAVNDTDGDGDIDNDDRYLQYLSQLSYAGGLVGVLDFDTNGEYSSVYNVNKVTIGENSSVSVVADISGFVAGYIGRGVSANRLTSIITDDSFVEGSYIAGGLVGEHYGKVRYSQVTYKDSSEYDEAFANYVLDETVTALDNADNDYGTLEFVRSSSSVEDYKNVAGGFVGVNYGGHVDNSYTKANVSANANYVGGFAGVTYGGTLNSVYAQNYLDLTNVKNLNNPNNRTEKVGGLVAYNSNKNTNENLAKIYQLNSFDYSALKVDTVVVGTFFDKVDMMNHYGNIFNEIEAFESGEITEYVAKNVKFDYLVAESNHEIISAQGGVPYNVYYLNYGKVDEDSKDYTYIYYKDYYESVIKNLANDNEKKKAWNSLIDTNEVNNVKATEAKDIRELYNLEYSNQEEVFTTLFLSYDVTVWEKDHTKYFPTLKENPTVNFYNINTEADLLLILLNPDGNFVINGDIELSTERVNYVLDVIFTGTLIGRPNSSGMAPTIKNIRLYSDGNTSTAGFFKQTGNEEDKNGATITNVNFEYTHFVANNGKATNKNIQDVGLLSPVDYGSEISGVNIKATNTATIESKIGRINNKEAAIVTDDNTGATITNFGGLYGTSTGSNIINCSTNLITNICSYKDSTSNIGGLVGYSTKSVSDEYTMILNSGFTGKLKSKNTTNIGGIVGTANITTVTGGNINVEVDTEFEASNYIGGIAGYQCNAYFKDATITLIVSSNYTSYSGLGIDKAAHYIGGVSGLVDISGETENAGAIGVLVTLYLNTRENIGTIAAGGIYGLANKYAKIQDSIAWSYGSISGAYTTKFGGLVGHVNANLISIDNCLAYVENGLLTPSVKANGISLRATNRIVIGGFIASIQDLAGVSTVVEIKNSSSSGAVWPESANEINLTSGGFIGLWNSEEDIKLNNSIVSSIDSEILYETNITNSYTTLMVETSAFKVGASVKYNVSAIIGDIANCEDGTTININKVYYSSDFTLSLEDKINLFSSNPIDLTAQAILMSYQKKEFFKDSGWDTSGGGLPYRTSLTTKLGNITDGSTSILSRYINSNGYSLNPSRGAGVEGTDASDKENYGKVSIRDLSSESYKYYFVSLGKTFAVSGNFYGVILGGGKEITYIRDNVNDKLTLKDHSVLSNLKVVMDPVNLKEIVESGKEFSFVSENNGTIFNLYLDYFYKPVGKNKAASSTPATTAAGSSEMITVTSGGGIVNINSGVMLYCYNTGSLEEVITANAGFGGIATTNTGYIAHSGFVGTLTAPAGETITTIAGFTYNNQGTIYNSYSAGVISSSAADGKYHSTFIKNNSGRLENCFYDRYANAEFDDIESEGTKLLEGKTTEILQGVSSGLEGNWKNYPMQAKVVLDSTDPTNVITKIEYIPSYNYGYPIYVIHQSYIYQDNLNTEIKTTEYRGLDTGDGSHMSPYLLSHLGTIDLIDSKIINATDDGNFILSNDLLRKYAFTLVNDIDADKNDQNKDKDTDIMEDWDGVGSIDRPFTAIFTSSNRSNMVIIEDGSDIIAYTTNNALRYINNLTGSSGLFNVIGDKAIVTNLAFGNVFITNNGGSSGALANEVDVFTGVSIMGVFLGIGDRANMQITAANVGGLIGMVSGKNKGVLRLQAISTYISDDPVDIYGVDENKLAVFDLYSNSTATNIGSVLGATNGDIIINLSGVQFSMDSNIGVLKAEDGTRRVTGDNVGGLFGSVGGSSIINITSVSITEGKGEICGITNVGGFAGITQPNEILYEGDEIEEGIEINSSGGSIVFSQTGGLEINLVLGDGNAYNVGGLVGAMQGGSFVINRHLTYKEEIDTKPSVIKITKILAKLKAGGVVGLMSGGVFACLEKDVCNLEVKSLITDDGTAGGVAGFMTNLTDKNGVYIEAPSVYGFTVKLDGSDYKAVQFGGVVGTIVSGSVGFIKEEVTTPEASKPEVEPTIAEPEVPAEPDEPEVTNEFPIKVSGKVRLKQGKQVGTIAGKIFPTEGTDTYDNVKLICVVSTLNVTIEKGSNKEEDAGLGGIAGYIKGDISSKITFGKVKLEGNKIEALIEFKNVGGLFGNLKATNLQTIGEKADIQISELKILGTYNVGGFAGIYVQESAIRVDEKFSTFLSGTEIGTIGIAGAEDEEEPEPGTEPEPEEPGTEPEPKEEIILDFDPTNFGGLFGKYSSNELLYHLIESAVEVEPEPEEPGTEPEEPGIEPEEPDKLPFVNINKVLNEIDLEQEVFKIFTLKGDEKGNKHTIRNVGGIAGLLVATDNITIQGVNQVDIGTSYENGDTQKFSDLTDVEFQSDEIQSQIIDMQYVGGIIGRIIYEEKVVVEPEEPETEPDAGTEPEEPETEPSTGIPDNFGDSKLKVATFQSIENTGTISGYQYVGGITSSIDCMNIYMKSANIDSDILGYKYLGGFAGKISTIIRWLPETEMMEVGEDKYYKILNLDINTYISGHSYLGGVIGEYSYNGEMLNDLYSINGFNSNEIKINGLINIGGVVGCAKNLRVYGTALDGKDRVANGTYKFNITGNSNIGGIIGVGTNVHVFEFYDYDGDKEYFDDVKININSVEYKIGPDTKAEDKEKEVSYMPTSIGGIIGNAQKFYLANCTPIGNIESKENKHQEVSSLNNYIISKDSTGYKVGEYKPKAGTEPEEKEYVNENVNKDLKGYESVNTGIGGLVGTAHGDEASTFYSTVSGINIYAPTGFNVGGIVGYYEWESTNNLNLSNYNDSTLYGKAYIAGAMGVGALFGYLHSEDTITAEGTLDRPTVETYLQRRKTTGGSIESVYGMYVGGLIGRSSTVNALKVTKNANIFVDNTYGEGFGGLVGWLDGNLIGGNNLDGVTFIDEDNINRGGLVGTANYKNKSIKISGSHKEEFTVDTLNMNYAGFGRTETIQEDESNNMFYLINNFTATEKVSITFADEAVGLSERYNPIRWAKKLDTDSSGNIIKTHGWAKEYTMFRKIDFIYTNEDEEIVSKGIVYNAEYVTEVAYQEDNAYTANIDESKIIEYTIYDSGTGPILYSKYGIASEFLTYSATGSGIEFEKVVNDYFKDRLIEYYGKTAGTEIVFSNKSRYFIHIKNWLTFEKQSYTQTNIGSDGMPDPSTVVSSDGTLLDYKSRLNQTGRYEYINFPNFRSDIVLRTIVANSITDFDFSLFALDVYLIKTMNDSIYKDTFFKYDSIFMEANEEYVNNGQQSNPETYELLPVESGCLFDVASSMMNKIPSNIRDKKYFLFDWAKEDKIYSIKGLSKTEFKSYEELMRYYILNIYEGQYGFLGDLFYREAYFQDKKLNMYVDKVRKFKIPITRGATTFEEYVEFYYYSLTLDKEKGEDKDDKITLTEEQALIWPKYTEYEPQSGDKMAKYMYADGEYYINNYAMKYNTPEVTFDDALSKLDVSKPYYYKTKDGAYYIAKNDNSGNVGAWFTEDGLNVNNLVETKTANVTLGFEVDPEYSASGYNGYDYINVPIQSIDQLYWKLVDYDPSYKIRLPLAYRDDYSAYFAQGEGAIMDPVYCLIPVMSSADDIDIVNDLKPNEINVTNLGVTSFVGHSFYEDEYYTTEALLNGRNLSPFQDRLNGNVILKYVEREISYEQSVLDEETGEVSNETVTEGALNNDGDHEYVTVSKTFYYYMNTGGAWYDKDLLETGNNVPVYEIVDSNEIYVYKKDGTNYNEVLLKDVDPTKMEDYYYLPNPIKKLSDIYRYEENDDGVKVWVLLRRGFYAEDRNHDGLPTIHEIVLRPKGNYYENKNNLQVGDYELYTRYKYDPEALSTGANEETWNRFLSLLPSTGRGYMREGYNIAEIVMFSFNFETGVEAGDAYSIIYKNTDKEEDLFWAGTMEIEITNPTKEGATFEGWYIDSALTTKAKYKTESGKVILDLTQFIGGVILYAKWE